MIRIHSSQITVIAILVPLLFLPFCLSIFAQSPLATVFGTVRDQTGGMLDGVQIEMREESTGAVRSTLSVKNGTFIIPVLPPGRYTATATLAEFKKGVIKNVTLNVGDKTALNFVLEVGSNQESITVEANAQLTQTESSSVG